jgi:hypothetical protein
VILGIFAKIAAIGPLKTMRNPKQNQRQVNSAISVLLKKKIKNVRINL